MKYIHIAQIDNGCSTCCTEPTKKLVNQLTNRLTDWMSECVFPNWRPVCVSQRQKAQYLSISWRFPNASPVFKMLPHLSSPVQFVIKLQIFIHFTVQVSKLFRAGHVFGFRSLFICPLAFCGHSTCHRWLRLETSFVRVVLGPGGSLSEKTANQQPKPSQQKTEQKTCFRPQDKLEKWGN